MVIAWCANDVFTVVVGIVFQRVQFQLSPKVFILSQERVQHTWYLKYEPFDNEIFSIYVYIYVCSHFDYLSEYFFAGLTFQTREGTKVQISQMIWSTEFSIRGTASLECLQYLVPTLLSLDQRVYNPFDVLDHSLFVLRHECPQHKTPKSQKSILLIKL